MVIMSINNIYINCGGSLYSYKSKKEAMDFFEDCIYGSEGSERERYTEIYFSIKENLKSNKRCFSDGTRYVYTSDIDPDSLSESDEKILLSNFKIDKSDLMCFKANNYMYDNDHKRIYNNKELETIEEIYDYYIKDDTREQRTFYMIDRDFITCIDDNDENEYFSEKFPTKDYIYADKWLKGEIEYKDYLNNLKKSDDLSF